MPQMWLLLGLTQSVSCSSFLLHATGRHGIKVSVIGLLCMLLSDLGDTILLNHNVAGLVV